jgi:DDE superfamily endonuclease/Helix-turn-helix domain
MTVVGIAIRHRILLEYSKHPNLNAVARKLNVDPRTVKRWVVRSQSGGLAVLKRSGRKCLLSIEAARKAVELLLSGKFDNCAQVAVELRNLGLTNKVVHATTLSRHAKAQALADGTPILPKTGKPSKALTAKNQGERLAFCQANMGRNWGHVMITDRKKFLFSYPGVNVRRVQWLKKGEQRVAFRPNNPMAVNMYAGITKHGVTKAHLVTGTSKLQTTYTNLKGKASKNITSAEYEDVLTRTLLPEGARLFASAGLSGWILQQDNDPTHKKPSARALKAWNAKRRGQVKLLENWPPNSPDLSPIENAWAHVQATVNAAGCKDFDEFQATLLKAWRDLDVSVVKGLMASLPTRLRACVAVEGGITRF